MYHMRLSPPGFHIFKAAGVSGQKTSML